MILDNLKYILMSGRFFSIIENANYSFTFIIFYLYSQYQINK